jgi:hypothetical protein
MAISMAITRENTVETLASVASGLTHLIGYGGELCMMPRKYNRTKCRRRRFNAEIIELCVRWNERA